MRKRSYIIAIFASLLIATVILYFLFEYSPIKKMNGITEVLLSPFSKFTIRIFTPEEIKGSKIAELEKEKNPIDLITVTCGPGLEPTLWTGITFAQELSKQWKVPIMSVNHMEGHIFSVFIKDKKKFEIPEIKYPILSLLVSGGHTELVLIKKWMDYKIIGETLDDAVGEAFDKVARMLGLPYPGGPQISALAETI